MRLVLTGRHVPITPNLRALVDRKLARLQRLLNDSVVSAQVVLTLERNRHVSDLTVHVRGHHVLAARTIGPGWATSLSAAVAKVEQQAQKLKGKWTEGKRRRTSARQMPAPIVAAPEPRTPRIVRAIRYPVKPMAVEDAALELMAGRDGFLVFRNANTGLVNVLHRRKTGEFALIEPEP
jgi:putative sigma-54 modulation protein